MGRCSHALKMRDTRRHTEGRAALSEQVSLFVAVKYTRPKQSSKRSFKDSLLLHNSQIAPFLRRSLRMTSITSGNMNRLILEGGAAQKATVIPLIP